MNNIKSTKGVTLLALIITIIILLILAGVAIVAVTGPNGLMDRAKQAKKNTEEAKIKEEIQTKIAEKQLENYGNISDDELTEILEKYGTLSEEEKIIDKTLTTKEGNYAIKVSEIFNGRTVNDDTKKPTFTTVANAPNIEGFNKSNTYYVSWNLTSSPYQINETTNLNGIVPNNWYDYENGKWANIKTTNNGLEAYWVWIPRYEYIVPTSEAATEIQVRFIGTDKKEGSEGYTKQADGTIKSSDGYTIHPAFTNEGNGRFGELDGIWVAKFEASSNTPDKDYGGGDDPTLKVQVKPGVQSWRNISTKNIFTVCSKMQNNGEVLSESTVDSHMMKNTEWGAVAILSQSKYGIFNSQSSTGANEDATQIWNNPNGYSDYNKVYTGYAGNSRDASTAYNSTTAPTNVYEYNTVNGTKASTTGTVYGIYDMAGGSWEYVAGCIEGQANAKFGVTAENSKKYVDLYTNSSNSYSNYEGAKTGDATNETKGWNTDYSIFVFSSSPVFIRGR